MELQHDTAKAIANLVTATAADQETVANLTMMNSNLTNKLAQAISKLSLAQTGLTTLKVKLATMQTHNNTQSNNTNTLNPTTPTTPTVHTLIHPMTTIVGPMASKSTNDTTAKLAKTLKRAINMAPYVMTPKVARNVEKNDNCQVIVGTVMLTMKSLTIPPLSTITQISHQTRKA
jgi:ribosomal protein L18E